TFTEIGAETGPSMDEPSVSRGAAFGDLDNDGDIDVVINNLDGAPTVLRNDGGNRQNFIVIDLVGGKSNRSAFGARVRVTAGDLTQGAAGRRGGGYIFQNDSRVHFRFGGGGQGDALAKRWPRGATEKFTGIAANSFIRLTEGQGLRVN